MNPTATADSPLAELRERYDAARKAAQDAWQAFEGRREAWKDKGAADGTAEQKAAEDAHADYKRAADRAEALQGELADAMLKGHRPAGGAGAIGRLAASEVRAALGERKAFDVSTGGLTLPRSFYSDVVSLLPQRDASVLPLIPSEPVDSDKVQHLVHTVSTFNAAGVPDGGTKPTSIVSVAKREADVLTIAHLSEPVDRALVADFGMLGEFLGGQLTHGLLLELERETIDGAGSGSDELPGILNTTGIGSHTQTTENKAEAIHAGLTILRNAHVEPTFIALRPDDWAEIRLEKTSDGDLLTAPVIADDPRTLWGVPVIVSTVVPSGRALVGNPATGARLFLRESVRIDFTEQGDDGAGGDLFGTNRVRYRCELRAALGVTQPSAFAEVVWA